MNAEEIVVVLGDGDWTARVQEHAIQRDAHRDHVTNGGVVVRAQLFSLRDAYTV